jgi:hypothetical protein
MVIPTTKYDELNELIHQPKFNEVKCSAYLGTISELMVKKENVLNFIKDSTQVAGFRGKSDFVISAKISEGGTIADKLFIWELKAPQSNIFNVMEGNKLTPSEYLIDAENKLLNYVDEFKRNEVMREHFSLTGSVIQSRNVIPGGLIISRNDLKLWDKKTVIHDKDSDYETAKRIREEYFYNCCNIKLYTWDDILNEIRKKFIEEVNISGHVTVYPGQQKPDTKII